MPDGWWLRTNDTGRQPNHVICFDTEARRVMTKGREVQTFRCAVASHDARPTNAAPWRDPKWGRFTDPEALWRWVSWQRAGEQRTVVVAHNLAYDLRVSQALRYLPDLGWEMEPPMMDRNRALFRFKRGRRRLVMVDSMNWLPKSLEHVGDLMGIPKPPLPDDDDDDDAWFHRCEADVTILRAAWLRLLDFGRAEDLGTWKPTGAGQALAAYRHRFMTARLLVHHDDAARVAEREAAHCGRAEAWQWGTLAGGPWEEWDTHLAYAHVMAESEVPTILRGWTDQERFWGRWTGRSGVCGLARVEVTTEVPCVPQRGPHGFWWPVGTFDTTLWDHELRLVEETGGSWRFREGWLYSAGPALREFADWALWYLALGPDRADPVCQLAVKHFTRAIVGKFGGQYRDWEEWGDALGDDLTLWSVVEKGVPGPRYMIDLAGKSWMQGLPVDSEQSVPQIWSWIQAETRVRLWRAMTAAGFDHVVYVDTDGLIVDRAGVANLRRARIPHLRKKSEFRTVRVLGPRQLVLDDGLRMAGGPRNAVKIGADKWKGEVWTEIVTSLRLGEHDRVTVRPRIVQLRGTDHRRAHLPEGRTEPFRA